MSSLAAVQADGYYYPPNWSPSKGNKDKFHHSHPLGNRARKLHLGIVIVRFEMPVNVWCDGCGEHIARGVRYNAEKKKCGTYFTSDVFEFQMNCHLCGQRFIIKTDPENRDYEFVSGLHRKVETFDVKEIGTREFDDKEQALMRADAIRSLENKEEDSMKFEKAVPTLDRLKDLEEKLHTNEDSLNQRVRSKLREIRKAEERREARASAAGLSIRLLPTSRSDIRKSRSVAFERKSKAEVAAKLKDVKARSGDIFGREDARMEHTLKRVIANGVDLKGFKKTETKTDEPMIKVIAKPKIKAKIKSKPEPEGENEIKNEVEIKAESTSKVKMESEKEAKPQSELKSDTEATPCKGKIKNTLGLVPLTYGEEDD